MRTPPKAPRWALFCLFAPFAIALSSPAFAVPPGNGKLQIIQLNAAQGDAAVLISPEGQVAMFDDGSSTSFCSHCPSCATVASELQSLGVTHVALHFASHYHADHIGCLGSLGITVDQGWDRAQSYASGAYTDYVNFLGAKRHTLTKGMVFALDSLSAHPVRITCVALGGDSISTSDENSLSVVMKVSYGEFDEEIGGDLEGSTGGGGLDIETRVGPQVGKIEVYKVHHHCSAYSTNENWLNATQPKIGIVSVGIGNGYGHPVGSTLTRLHNHGVHTYWTEQGQGAAPNPAFDKVANGMIRIVATWESGGVDSIYGTAIADSFTNYDQVPPSVALLSPNGGNVVAAGSVASVTWSASDQVGVTSIDLEYALDGTSWNPIVTGVPNTGSHSWTVPNAPTAFARIRVTAHDAAGNASVTTSASDFTIADQSAPAITVLSPNGGETWPPGSIQSVSWADADNVGVQTVDIDYSLHGAAGPWLVAEHGLQDNGDYDWSLITSASDSVLVRVTAFDAAGNQAADVSDDLLQVPQSALDAPGDRVVAFALATPHPNPSRGRVAMRFSLASPATTRLEVLDVTGRRVWGTPQDWLEAGHHEVSWDGRDDRGRPTSLGLYFVHLTSGANTAVTRFVRLQ